MDDQTISVFMTPILPGKAGLLRESAFSIDDKAQFFSKLGISKYHRWIQNIYNEHFLIHLVKSKDINAAFNRLKEEISKNDNIAKELRKLYLECLEVDLLGPHFIPKTKELTKLISMGVENENGAMVKEYCFVYPILPPKKQKMIDLYDDEKLIKKYGDMLDDYKEQVNNIYRFRGVSKNQLWIQETGSRSFLVIYQEITGPVTDARDKYLNVRDNELAMFLAQEFSEITGLSFEELLPNLESLIDFEVLR
ncbi:MAG: hypothetical protein H0U49_05575 [Parachlamydiaceae bacterium]|nr:hypothetical protein [Parachlamydiaceae bacterium]